MEWYNYLACFLLGVYSVNSIPHFIHGISGDPFPTPFAKPPGRGLSSPFLNVLWGLANIFISYLLFIASKISMNDKWSVILVITGFIAMILELCRALSKKIKEP